VGEPQFPHTLAHSSTNVLQALASTVDYVEAVDPLNPV
jgi:hypothetical protein